MLDANKLKKRFVWPESLHRDFVSAVFDIGLKNSTSKLLLQMLPQSRKISTGKIYINISSVVYLEVFREGGVMQLQRQMNLFADFNVQYFIIEHCTV